MNKIYELEHQIETQLGYDYFVIISDIEENKPYTINIINIQNHKIVLTIPPEEAIWFITPDSPNVFCTGPILPSTKYLNISELCERIIAIFSGFAQPQLITS
jgi:hypothetical protein